MRLVIVGAMALIFQDAPRRLVDQLGDDSPSIRDQAERQLFEMGGLAWDELVRALESDDPEIKDRAARPLKRIPARGSGLIRGKVTFSGQIKRRRRCGGGDPVCCPAPVGYDEPCVKEVRGEKRLLWVAVSLAKPAGAYPVPQDPVILRQVG